MSRMSHAVRCIAIALAAICMMASVAAAQKVAYRRYLNPRFKFGVSYPDHVLVPLGESENGDGEQFAAPDSSARMWAYGTYSLSAKEGGGLRDGYAEELRGFSSVSYKVIRNGWFVISGMHNGRIRYMKVMVKAGAFKVLLIEYDPAGRGRYDPIVAYISKTFAHTR